MTEENNYTPDAAKLKETQDGLDNFETAAANYIDAFTTAFDVKAAADKNLKAFKTTITSKYKAENGATWATKDVKSYGDDEKSLTNSLLLTRLPPLSKARLLSTMRSSLLPTIRISQPPSLITRRLGSLLQPLPTSRLLTTV